MKPNSRVIKLTSYVPNNQGISNNHRWTLVISVFSIGYSLFEVPSNSALTSQGVLFVILRSYII